MHFLYSAILNLQGIILKTRIKFNMLWIHMISLQDEMILDRLHNCMVNVLRGPAHDNYARNSAILPGKEGLYNFTQRTFWFQP